MAVAKIGDRVKIHYEGRLEDGTVFDSSEGREPLEFTAGGSEVIPGVSNAVVGMSEGENKTVTLSPEEAYGVHVPGLEQKVPRRLLPPEVRVGDPLQAQAGDQTIVVWVKELDDEFAVVDANHPLAGHTLTFDINLVEIIPAE